jgi:ABC-type transporter Mla MlaB component
MALSAMFMTRCLPSKWIGCGSGCISTLYNRDAAKKSSRTSPLPATSFAGGGGLDWWMAEADESAARSTSRSADTECASCTGSRDGVDLDVSWLAAPDLTAIDALVRLHIVTHRCGRTLRLHDMPSELVELLELVGLRDVLHVCRCARLA